MSQTEQKSPKFDFLKTFVLPALLVFLLPTVSYFFFRHAQSAFDAQIRDSILQELRSDPDLTEEQRAESIAFFSEVPFSQLVQDEELAAMVHRDTRFYYATFRWMIILSAGSIVAGVAVFLLAALCVALSLHSQYVQYLSLSVGWHVLRIYSATQAASQGVLLVALSFWVTALWFKTYIVKLIIVACIVAGVAVFIVIAAIFRRVNNDFTVEGEVLPKDEAAPIWIEMRRICAQVGTDPPDQIIAGIDDNFFVTEHPVTVGDKTYLGRTLFVSLSLLKQLQGSEADAVLAHEMAHFSGQDTMYSRKIAPHLSRYDHYLAALYEGGVTRPIYYFMLCFRALYQLSLGRLNRQREFRADRIAVATTSARDVAAALLRTVAYSKYRSGVEEDLFKQEQALESANVCERIEQGFCRYAERFVSGPDIGAMEQSHPFDSHPPLSERLQAIGMPVESEDTQTLLTTAGDGSWYQHIVAADQMEKGQWREYEEKFLQVHQQFLCYRVLPETAEEIAIVAKFFPPRTFEGGEGSLTLYHDKIAYDQWPDPIRYVEISDISLEENGVLKFSYQRTLTRFIPMSEFANQQEVIETIQCYFGRHLAAAKYHMDKREAPDFIDQSGSEDGLTVAQADG